MPDLREESAAAALNHVDIMHEVSRREAFIKALVWRFAVSIPVGFLLCFLIVGSLIKTVELTVVCNVVLTFLHYLYERYWGYFWNAFVRYKSLE